VEKSGWVLFAWVLMNNHYHFIFKTPVVASLIRERALVSSALVTNRLTMGATGAVTRTIREARELAAGDCKVRRLARQLTRNVQFF
jgi:hypothetical protein